jgi:hypothetical protein
MRHNQKKPLQIAISGMEGRAYKMMEMFFQGPCKGSAIVVKDHEAEAEILDADFINAKRVLAEKLSAHPERPVIVLSLQDLALENIIFVKKPVQIACMQKALEQARNEIIQRAKKRRNTLEPAAEVKSEQDKSKQVKSGRVVAQTKPSGNEQAKKILDTEEQKKTSKHRTAMQLDEKGFSSFIGTALDIDFNDPEQLLSASYKPENYYQGYVHSAVNLCLSKGRILSLDTGWKSLTIFPHSYEMWIDSDDKQLKAFSALPASTIAEMGNTGRGIKVKPVDPKHETETKDPKKFQAIDAFLWKLSLWTSKGRYPCDIDINHPVYLKRWPNMTRLVVTPHAMRIAALLIEGPRTLINTAQVLKIKPQYVFVFFSAAYALGLAEQAERSADVAVTPQDLAPNRTKGILEKIMYRLRGSK